jgi:hypothetical protein
MFDYQRVLQIHWNSIPIPLLSLGNHIKPYKTRIEPLALILHVWWHRCGYSLLLGRNWRPLPGHPPANWAPESPVNFPWTWMASTRTHRMTFFKSPAAIRLGRSWGISPIYEGYIYDDDDIWWYMLIYDDIWWYLAKSLSFTKLEITEIRLFGDDSLLCRGLLDMSHSSESENRTAESLGTSACCSVTGRKGHWVWAKWFFRHPPKPIHQSIYSI